MGFEAPFDQFAEVCELSAANMMLTQQCACALGLPQCGQMTERLYNREQLALCRSRSLSMIINEETQRGQPTASFRVIDEFAVLAVECRYTEYSCLLYTSDAADE